VSVGPVGVIKDSKGSRPIYIKYVEGLGSPKATPNLDVKSRGPNHTTTLALSKEVILGINLRAIKCINTF